MGVCIFMVKVSVIMPVYNAQDFLTESIDCILNQTLSDLELICVDDGSTDGSLDMLNEFASKDSRIQVYHQQNRGGGAARNVAMTYAKGKYLYCMDADDLIELNALEKLYDIAEEKDTDFIIFQAINYDDELDKYYHTDYYDMNYLADFVGDSIFGVDDVKDYFFNISVTPWCKFYNLDFVKKSKAQFAEGLIFHDNIFFWEVFFNAKRIYFLREVLYTRRRHMKSSTGTKNKNHVSTIKINNMIIKLFMDYGYFDEKKKTLYNKKLNLVYRRFSEIKDEFKPYFYSVMKEDFTKMLTHERYDEFLGCVNKSNKVRFDDVVNSKDYDDFKKLYGMHELKINTLNVSSKDGGVGRFKKYIKRLLE